MVDNIVNNQRIVKTTIHNHYHQWYFSILRGFGSRPGRANCCALSRKWTDPDSVLVWLHFNMAAPLWWFTYSMTKVWSTVARSDSFGQLFGAGDSIGDGNFSRVSS